MKDKISILMAIYRPNLIWLEEQLTSLNNQTYKNLELLVWNDCPEEIECDSLICKIIKNIPFRIYHSKINMGSNKVFEELTKLASGDYIAYCDQDDIWLESKIEILVNAAKKENSELICSDMYVINAKGKIVANSITVARPYQIFYHGDDMFLYLCSKNFVVGCTTLVKTEFAKSALPFPDAYIHDWWLALYASAYGRISIVNTPLIKYRIHDSNQTGLLKDVVTKDDYYKNRLMPLLERCNILRQRFPIYKCKDHIELFCKFIEARHAYHNKCSIENMINLSQYYYLNKKTVLFELIMQFIPDLTFKYLIGLIKRIL